MRDIINLKKTNFLHIPFRYYSSGWGVDFIYATKDEKNKFERIAMAEITVQTQLNAFDTG